MPRATAQAKEETRQRLLRAAARGFRTRGYVVLQLMPSPWRPALRPVLSTHIFGSKAAMFQAALAEGPWGNCAIGLVFSNVVTVRTGYGD